MSTADDAATEQIRVSAHVKRELEQLKRGDESFNDVLNRVLDDDRDLLAGFGRWSDDTADLVEETRERYEEESKERMRRLAGNE